MAVYLVDVTPDQIERVDALVKAGAFRDVEQFIAVAIRNQIAYESSEADPGLRKHGAQPLESASNRSRDRIEAFSRVDLAESAEASRGAPSPSLLWGQYYRFLPLKAVLRVAVGRFRGEEFPLDELVDVVQLHIMSLVRHIEMKAAHAYPHIKLHVGFPSSKRDMTKSMDRFVAQYVGRFSSKHQLTGFPSVMGFLSGEPGNGGNVRLTREGLKFACLPNPVLDVHADERPLGEVETDFVLRHISESMPGEATHVREVCRLIGAGAVDPSTLDGALSGFYDSTYRRNASTKELSLMRSGCISRLTELGVVIRERREGGVRHALSAKYSNDSDNVFRVLEQKQS